METCLRDGRQESLALALPNSCRQGRLVHVLDLPTLEAAPRLRNIRERIHYFQGSVLDLELLRSASRDVDVIFHQPMLGSVLDSIKDPLSTNRLGTEGAINVLSAAHENSVRRVIYLSSASVYGHGGRLPRSEDCPLEPISPHGVAMLAGENYCVAFAANHGLETVRLRPFNVYGSGVSSAEAQPGVLESFADAVASGRRPLVFGDGMQTRDFVHVDDVVQANLLAAANPRAAGKAYNIGSGQQTTLLSLLGMMGRHLDITLKPMITRARPGDIRFSLADTTASQRDLGCCPCTNLASDLAGLLGARELVLKGPKSPRLRVRVFARGNSTD